MTKSNQQKFSELESTDGCSIPFIFSESHSKNVRGVYVLTHGLGVDKNEYLGFYSKMTQFLNNSGFDVIRFDFRAHGDSKGKSTDFTLMNCIADTLTIAKAALYLSDSNRLRIFGTSFGAGPAVAAGSYFKDKLDCLTLLAPAISYRELYISPTDPVRAGIYGRFFADSVFNKSSINLDNGAELDWKNAIEFAYVDLMPPLETISDRVAIIHGEADSMVPVILSKEIYQRLPRMELNLIDRMDHGFMDIDDELGVGDASKRNLEFIFEKAIR